MRRRGPASRALRLRPRWPWVLGWTAGVAAGPAALVALAYYFGREKPAASTDFVDSVLATVSEPAVALVLALGALTLTAFCFRRLWLELLAYLPGRVQVPDFEAGAELEDADPAQLTMRFRRRLAVCHLQSLAPVPATSAQGDFLDVLGQGGVDSGNILGSLLSLLRAAKPPHAFEVKGVLMRRSGSQSYGVTLQVTRLPRDAIRVETLWDTSWVRVLRRAADHATAAILTRTRRCEAPWAAWRRYPMPGELFHDYERAAELDEERRYDEALDRYYRALERDPLNIGLRLQIGFLQEKIGLPLDALATYEGMETVAKPGGLRLPGGLLRNKTRIERDPAMVIGRYRRAVLLAQSELARQWRRTGPPDLRAWTRRDRQRRDLRRRLGPALERLFGRIDDSRRIGRLPLAELIGEPPGTETPDTERELLELQELLQIAACDEIARLRKEVGGPLRTRGTTLTASAAGLAECGMRQRLAWTQAGLAAEPDVAEHPTVADVKARLDVYRPRGGFRNWPELYNAACAYSLPLVPPPERETEAEAQRRTELAEQAVKLLERAMGRADSAYVAGCRNWLISEDPDLDGLRSHISFKHFEAMYFPSPRATPQRPRDLHQWELSRYTSDLLSATALRWEECWHRRGRQLDSRPDLHEMLDWWADEGNAWQRVQQMAKNHRHWRARYELVADMQGWSAKYGLEALAVPYPRYTDDSGAGWEDETDVDAAERTVLARDLRLKQLGGLIARAESEKKQACSLLDDIRSWQSELRQLDAGGRRARRWHVARLCDAHAGLWGRLHEWLESPPSEDGHRAFEEAIAHTAALWRAADLRYRTGDVLRDVPWRLRAGGLRGEELSHRR